MGNRREWGRKWGEEEVILKKWFSIGTICFLPSCSPCAVPCLVAQSCLTLCDSMDYSLLGSSVHGDSPGKNTGVGCHTLLQGILPTQGSNPGLPHCRWTLPAEPPGKPSNIYFSRFSPCLSLGFSKSQLCQDFSTWALNIGGWVSLCCGELP